MNILFFCVRPVVATDGGVSRITDSLVKVFRDHGHNVFILSAKKNASDNVDKNQYYLPNCFYDLNCLSETLLLCKRNKIDLIINQSSMDKSAVLFFAKLRKNYFVKFFSCIHNCTETPILNYAYQKEFGLRKKRMAFVFYILKNNWIKKILRFFYILKYRKLYTMVAESSDRVLVLNDKLVKEFQIFIPEKYHSKISVVPNCLPIRDWFSQTNKEKILLWVGRLDVSVKRIDLMLNIWKKIYKDNLEWKLFVLGDGPYFDFAKKFAKDNGLKNIFFEGRVNPYPYYEKASLLALTSTHESFSLVTLEALQHKVVPIIMNTFPFASSLIKNAENGLLVNDFTCESMATSIDLLMKNDELRCRMSEKGPLSALSFSPESVYCKYWAHLLGE